MRQKIITFFQPCRLWGILFILNTLMLPHFVFSNEINWNERRVFSLNDSATYIVNTGLTTLEVSGINTRNALGEVFVLSLPALPFSIQPNDSSLLRIRFKPLDEKKYSDTVVVYFKSFPDSTVISITGTGILPKIQIADLTFPSQKIGLSYPPQQFVINNPSSSSDLYVYKVFMKQSSDFQFDINAKLDNFIVGKNSSVSIPVFFTPKTPGMKTLKLVVRSDAFADSLMDSPIVEDTVNLAGWTTDVEINPYLVDLGEVSTCFSSTFNIKIKNLGLKNLDLQSVNHTNQDYFSIISYPNVILPDSSGLVPIMFSPKDTIEYFDTIKICTSAFDTTIYIKGKGSLLKIQPKFTKFVTNPVTPGTIIPLIFEVIIPDFGDYKIDNFDAFIDFDTRMISWDDTTVVRSNIKNWNWTINKFNYGNQIIIMGKGEQLSLPLTITDTIYVKTLLSDNSSTRIVLTAKNNNSYFSCLRFDSDTLNLQSVTCFTEGRLIKSSGYEFFLNEFEPNMSMGSIKVKFGLGYEGPTKLLIIDIMGKTVMTIVNESLAAGMYEKEINVSDLPTGVYILLFNSGQFKQTKKITIFK